MGDTVRNLYEVLHVSPNASLAVIKAAHRALSREVHPDRPGGNEKLFLTYQQAYEILSDPDQRRTYDAQRVASANEAPDLKGRYKILSKIAEGAMGVTYLAEHRVTGMRVCIKHCSGVASEYTDIMLEEARSIWDLRHFGLPTMRDVFLLDDGSVALVMTYVPGLTIEQLCEKIGGAMDPEDVAWITERTLNALMYMHFHGVVHGDIKPQNIIVQPDRHLVTVVDFGLATVRPRAQSTSKGFTQAYAAPELMQGRTPLPESDLYCLGLVMLYGLSGSHDRVIARELPSAIPNPLKTFIRSLIRLDPRERPNWQTRDLMEEFRKVRIESFGRAQSGMRPIVGLTQ